MSQRLLYAAMDPIPYAKGAAVRIEASVRACLAQGFQVRLITSAAPPLEGFAPRLEMPGLEHFPIDLKDENFLDRALAFRSVVAMQALEFKPHIAIVRSIWEGLGALEVGPTTPLIYEVHGFPSVELPYHFPAVRNHPQLLGRLIEEENRLLQKARLLITPSHTGGRNLHARGVAPRKIRVIANSLGPADFNWEDPAPAEASQPHRLLYIGTLAPWQGVEVLVEAMRHLKNRMSLKLVLAGTRKGPWLRRIRHLASALGVRSELEILGPLDRAEVRRQLQLAQICLAPLPDDARNSSQGCCPIKILEYMAAGKPILSTRIAPVEELLRHRETGWLVAPNSPKALADGIAHLLAHPDEAQALGRQARQSATRYSRRDFDRRLAACLVEACDERTQSFASA